MVALEGGADPRNGSSKPTATVGRVTAVLDAFLDADRDLGVTELAARLGLAKSVVHRLMTALAEAEYLSHDNATRRYSLGPKALRLGLVAVGQMRIRERALPYLRELAAATGETATLSLLVGDHRVYAEQIESAHPVRQSVPIGGNAALYIGASGKAILAFLPASRRSAILRQAAHVAPQRADGQLVDFEALLTEIDEIRRRGFAMSQSERALGAASAAAPVFDHHGDVVASVSVAGVTVRHGPIELAEFGELAATCAASLSADLGYPVRVSSGSTVAARRNSNTDWVTRAATEDDSARSALRVNLR
jgi:IclR family acetate operon transcriptional repressor